MSLLDLAPEQWAEARGRLLDEQGRLFVADCLLATAEAQIAGGRLEEAQARMQAFNRNRNFAAAWPQPGFLDAYFAYYGLTYIPQLQLLLWDSLARQPETEVRLLDIGVGTATTSLAAADLVARLCGTTAGDELARTRLKYLGLDALSRLQEYSREMLLAYEQRAAAADQGAAARLARQMSARHSWALCEFGTVGHPLPDVEELIGGLAPNRVVIANTVNEMHPAARRSLARLLCSDLIPVGARMVLVAPSSPSWGQFCYADMVLRWSDELAASGKWAIVTRCASRGPRSRCDGRQCGECHNRVTRGGWRLPQPYLDVAPGPRQPISWFWAREMERC